VLYEHVEFLKAAFVKKHCNSLTCSELAFLVLCVDPLLTAAHSRSCPALYQFLDFFLLNAHNAIMMMVLGLAIIPTKLTFFFTRQIKSCHFGSHYA
jgi:hypothetical protein